MLNKSLANEQHQKVDTLKGFRGSDPNTIVYFVRFLGTESRFRFYVSLSRAHTHTHTHTHTIDRRDRSRMWNTGREPFRRTPLSHILQKPSPFSVRTHIICIVGRSDGRREEERVQKIYDATSARDKRIYVLRDERFGSKGIPNSEVRRSRYVSRSRR